jgi:cell division protein FtsN
MSDTAAVDEGYDDLDDEGGLSGFWILIIFLVVLATFAGIVWVAYQKGLSGNVAEADLPVVAADPAPTREEVALAPVEDGRPEVFDELNDTTPTRVVADADPAEDPLEDYLEGGEGTPVDVPTSADVQTAAGTAAPTPASTPTTTASNSNQVASQPQRTADATPARTEPVRTEPARTEPAPAATTARTTPATNAPAGSFAVQVGAFGSRDEAMEFYGALMQRIGPLVGDQSPYVQTATVKGRTYHRLWLGAFADQSAAQSYCQQLSARGQDCYVQKRS